MIWHFNMYHSIKNLMATTQNSVKLCFLQLQQIQVLLHAYFVTMDLDSLLSKKYTIRKISTIYLRSDNLYYIFKKTSTKRSLSLIQDRTAVITAARNNCVQYPFPCHNSIHLKHDILLFLAYLWDNNFFFSLIKEKWCINQQNYSKHKTL
jgi:hypothetical protein